MEKIFKILMNNKRDKTITLVDVKGETIDDYVFLYHNLENQLWYIEEYHLGMLICQGKTKEEVLDLYNNQYKNKMLKVLKNKNTQIKVLKLTSLYRGKVKELKYNIKDNKIEVI